MKAWIVDDDESIRWVLQRALGAHDVDVKSFPGGVEMLDELESDMPDVLLTDIRMPGIDGLKLLERVKAQAPDLPIIIMTAHSDLDSAVAAYRKGAFEYLPKPFDVDDAVELVQRAKLDRHVRWILALPIPALHLLPVHLDGDGEVRCRGGVHLLRICRHASHRD